MNKSLLSNAAIFPIALLLAGIWVLYLAKGKGNNLTRKDMWALAFFQVALLGLSLYQLLFEVWPRYLFLFAPFYAIIAAISADGLSKRIMPHQAKS